MDDDSSDSPQDPAVVQTIALTAGVLLVTAATLHLLGRVFWCQCGSWVPWSWDVWSQHSCQHLIDPYFFTHVLHGVVLYGLLHCVWKSAPRSKRFMVAVLLEAGWELLENCSFIIDRYREATISLGYYGDSISNSLFDIGACALGFILVAHLKLWQSVTFFVATEVLLLLTIRDCLTLNIVMIVYPFDAVRQWQAAF